MLRVVALAALAVGCGYRAPDYDDVRFRCDPEHPCPAGMFCVADRCEATLPVDGPPPDGRFEGIACGASTCAPGQECCDDVVAGLRCQAASLGCAGVSASCDGPEDCPGGECCITGTAGACVGAGACPTGTLCHEASDCMGRNCCPLAQTPWRSCLGSC